MDFNIAWKYKFEFLDLTRSLMHFMVPLAQLITI